MASGLVTQQTGSANNTVGIINAAALGGEIGKRAVENNYLYAFEAERKAELDILIQTETDPEKRKAYEAERAAIIKRDIDRQQAIEASCQRFNKGSAGCASQIAEANRAKASYSASTDLIRGVGMQADKRRYADLFKNDFYRVNEALQGKDPVTVQKEAFAIEVSKAKNTHPEDEYTWISNGIDLGWLGEYQGWGRSIKGLPKSENFATKVPKEANANGKLPVVSKTENYENQTAKIHISSGAENVALYTKLKSNLIGKEIGGGHAFSKHIIKQGEFRGLNIATQEQFEKHIENVVNNYTSFKELSNGRTAYWHQETGTVVIRNPKAKDGGTAFQPRDGRKYFDDKLK